MGANANNQGFSRLNNRLLTIVLCLIIAAAVISIIIVLLVVGPIAHHGSLQTVVPAI